MNPRKKQYPVVNFYDSPSLKSWGEAPAEHGFAQANSVLDCGWGRLIFGQTFTDNCKIADILRTEDSGRRDIAFYLRDPQVVAGADPQELFIDPSYTYRLWLEESEVVAEESPNFEIRALHPERDLPAVNRIYQARGMVTITPDYLKSMKPAVAYWVAADKADGTVLGIAMRVDHATAFGDPEQGASLWALAVDAQATHPGIGMALVRYILSERKKAGCRFMDVSVLHDNKEAIEFYEKLGFQQVPVFCVKRKNAINERLFAGPQLKENGLNIYAMIIINEARRRGIRVDILDPENNYFQLSYGGRTVICRESLSELTSSIAMSRCADKAITHRLLNNAGLNVPAQQLAATPARNQKFLDKYGSLVVKPADAEQGAGITIDVTTRNELATAIDYAALVGKKILLEQMVPGQDLRIIVIDHQVVAAAIRRPPAVVGDGKHRILDLIRKQSRRREKATQGESKIPIDAELRRTVTNAGYTLEDVLPEGVELIVRRAANLHAGGTIHDVTDKLHPELAEAARQASHVLGIPVVGLDFIVEDPAKPSYYIIEANERPGLANHEPQPTAERFIGLLFPQSATR